MSCRTSSASRGSGTRRRMKLRSRDCSRATTSEIRSSCSAAIVAASFIPVEDGEGLRILWRLVQRWVKTAAPLLVPALVIVLFRKVLRLWWMYDDPFQLRLLR